MKTLKIEILDHRRGTSKYPWRNTAAVREGKFNGSVYYLISDLFHALDGHLDPKFFIDYAKKFFNRDR